MARQTSVGECQICGGTYSKSGMTRHLAACGARARQDAGSGRRKRKELQLFHLVVEGRYLPDYWLHLEMPAKTTLDKLDLYLRDIWLECCGHLSDFTIDGVHYDVLAGEEVDFMDGLFSFETAPMQGTSLDSVLTKGTRFQHRYDFGSTTHLRLRVTNTYRGPATLGQGILLLARNAPPEILCSDCGAQAAWICIECMWQGAGLLCETCREKHVSHSEWFMPIVNSPRTGVCGYTGGPLT